MEKKSMILLTICIFIIVSSCSIEDLEQYEYSIEATELREQDANDTIKNETDTIINDGQENNSNEEVIDADNKEDIVEHNPVNSMDNPIIIDYTNIKTVKVGDYVSVTGPAKARVVSNGSLAIGDSDMWSTAGLDIYVQSPGSTSSYIVEAFTANPGEYKDVFKSHAPMDISTEPSTVGGKKYSGCTVTVIGKVGKINQSEETGNIFGLNISGGEITDLELYY